MPSGPRSLLGMASTCGPSTQGLSLARRSVAPNGRSDQLKVATALTGSMGLEGQGVNSVQPTATLLALALTAPRVLAMVPMAFIVTGLPKRVPRGLKVARRTERVGSEVDC